MSLSKLQIVLHQNILKYAPEKKIVIFGTGEAAVKTVIQLGVLFNQVAFFVENKDFAENNFFYGKLVYNAKILNEKYHEDIYIIIASSFYKEISQQLRQYGYKEKKNFMQVPFLTKEVNESTVTNRIVNGVKVGKFTYGYEKHCFTGSLLKEIGAFCSINESVKIGEVNHPTNMITTHPILYTSKDEILGYEGVPGIVEKDRVLDIYEYDKNEKVIIKNDVWIGANAVILPGITINNGAIIGAGAVVTKDVPPYAVLGGVPAKVIKYRFNRDQIDILEKVQWWNWETDEIIEAIDLLKNPELFFGVYKI